MTRRVSARRAVHRVSGLAAFMPIGDRTERGAVRDRDGGVGSDIRLRLAARDPEHRPRVCVRMNAPLLYGARRTNTGQRAGSTSRARARRHSRLQDVVEGRG
jgi:hypothetical protein